MKIKAANDKLIGLSFPKYCGSIIAATLASTLSSFVDGCITGKMLGAAAMAAFGIAMPFILILVVVPGIILSSGGSICCSRFLGENNRERADASFTACCLAGMAVGLIVSVICLFCSGGLVRMMGVTGDVASEAVNYMRGFSIGAAPAVCLSIFMYYFNLDGHEKTSLIAVAVMTVADIALDLYLGVYLQLGLFGMALATSISYILAAAIFLILFLKGKSTYSIRLSDPKGEMKDILQNGYPSALNTLLVSLRCFLINMILLSVAGQIAVTAYSFQSNFNQFFVAAASGISTTVSALTGIFLGEKDRNKICASVRAGFRSGIVLTGILMLVLFFGAPLFSELLMDGTGEETAASVNALKYFSLSMPFSAICIVFISFYQTLGSRRLANLIAVGHGLVFIVLSALVLSRFLGMDGVWLSGLAGELLMLLTLFLYSWKKRKAMPKKPEDMILMDESFPEKTGTEYTAAAYCNDREAMQKIREELCAYLHGQGADRRTEAAWTDAWEYLTGLCEKGTFADVQSYIREKDGKEAVINIRFTGEAVFARLEKEKAENKAAEDPGRFCYRFGAGISFVNIRQKV